MAPRKLAETIITKFTEAMRQAKDKALKGYTGGDDQKIRAAMEGWIGDLEQWEAGAQRREKQLAQGGTPAPEEITARRLAEFETPRTAPHDVLRAIRLYNTDDPATKRLPHEIVSQKAAKMMAEKLIESGALTKDYKVNPDLTVEPTSPLDGMVERLQNAWKIGKPSGLG